MPVNPRRDFTCLAVALTAFTSPLLPTLRPQLHEVSGLLLAGRDAVGDTRICPAPAPFLDIVPGFPQYARYIREATQYHSSYAAHHILDLHAVLHDSSAAWEESRPSVRYYASVTNPGVIEDPTRDE